MFAHNHVSLCGAVIAFACLYMLACLLFTRKIQGWFPHTYIGTIHSVISRAVFLILCSSRFLIGLTEGIFISKFLWLSSVFFFFFFFFHSFVANVTNPTPVIKSVMVSDKLEFNWIGANSYLIKYDMRSLFPFPFISPCLCVPSRMFWECFPLWAKLLWPVDKTTTLTNSLDFLTWHSIFLV